MKEPHFFGEADARLQPSMREAAATILKRTRIAWQGDGDMERPHTGKWRPTGQTVRKHPTCSYLKLLATKF